MRTFIFTLLINLTRMLYYIVIELLGRVIGHRRTPDFKPCPNVCTGKIIFSLSIPRQQFQLIIRWDNLQNPKQQFQLIFSWIITLLSLPANVLWPAANMLHQCLEEKEWQWGEIQENACCWLSCDFLVEKYFHFSNVHASYIIFGYFRQCHLMNSQQCQPCLWRSRPGWR